jgi:hypothetical protein
MERRHPRVHREPNYIPVELRMASRLPVCVLITGDRQSAWHAAAWIAEASGSSLSVIDCDQAPVGLARRLMREHFLPDPNVVSDLRQILLLREVQSLSVSDLMLLRDFLRTRSRKPDRPRVIASSSISLYSKVREGRFPDDLFYKLNTLHIAL